jgi:hypothetical protein
MVTLLSTLTSGCATLFNGSASVRIERALPILAVTENGVVVAGALRDFAARPPTAAQAQAVIDEAPRMVELQPHRCQTTVYEVRTAHSYERVTVRSPVGLGWLVLNVMFGAGLGAIVDVATGAWCHYEASTD